jgi:homogentisate 1,2-dioxygenase
MGWWRGLAKRCVFESQSLGPDAAAFEHAPKTGLKPAKLTDIFETRFPQRVTAQTAKLPGLRKNHIGCWNGVLKRLKPSRKQARKDECDAAQSG